MSDLGAFESVFRRALRKRYVYESLELKTVLIISDLEGEAEQAFIKQVESFLARFQSQEGLSVICWGKGDFAPWPQLKTRLRDTAPSLVVSYRMLWTDDILAEKSLGSYIDLLSQDTTFPLLLMPHPKLFNLGEVLKASGSVLVATEHTYEDDPPVNYAVAFAKPDRPLILVHIEDEDTFAYYMKAIEKIPDLDTEIARTTLHDQLLAGPKQYAESVSESLKIHCPYVQVETEIAFGHLITAYRNLIEQHPSDLLVTHTKDDTQLAMHSIGYSLAVEFRQIPVLLI